MLAAIEEVQREGGVEQAAVEPDGGRPVEVLEAAELLEAGLAQAQLQPPWSRRLTSSTSRICRKSA